MDTTNPIRTSEQDAFEKTLMLHPEDRTAWSAYADYLTEKGEPRGEFMMVQLALEDENIPKPEREALKAREKELLAAHEREWLGNLVPYTLDYVKPEQSWRGDAQLKYVFTRGWITELTIERISVNISRACVKNPNLRFLQALHIHGQEYDESFEPGPDVPESAYESLRGYHALTLFPYLANLRKFHLGYPYSSVSGSEPYSDGGRCHTYGELADQLVQQMPKIEELVLLAHNVDTRTLFALPMPNLRFLQVDHSVRYPLDILAANKNITKLTHLICWPHALEYGDRGDEVDDGQPGERAYIRLKHLQAVCAANWPDLTFLRLRIADFGDEGAGVIVNSGILKRLKHLDLEHGCITEAGALLLSNSPDLKNLESLNLNDNAIQGIGSEAIKKVLPQAKVEGQHNDVPPFTSDYVEFLYQGDYE
ncbi:MAG: TIGR02996 domain-containing protein [Fimbriiglobus sp.]